MKNVHIIIFILSLFFGLFYVGACSNDDLPKFKPPSTHTYNCSGSNRMHAPGLSNPTRVSDDPNVLTCTKCHGIDLRGGGEPCSDKTVIAGNSCPPSCYTCHDQKW